MNKKIIILICALIALVPFASNYKLSAQYAAQLKPSSLEQFKLGVEAYFRGRYAQAILLFESALTGTPDSSLVNYWLGRAYLKSGYETTALESWQVLLDRQETPPFLRTKIENLRNYNSIRDQEIGRYVELARFPGKTSKGVELFLRPAGLLPQNDGSLIVVAHGSNKLVTIAPSGVVLQSASGGLAGFNGPFGISTISDGSFVVSEFMGDKLAHFPAGTKDKILSASDFRFGAKGIGDGQMLGPQFIASDRDGYIYISDFGNARIVKFDLTGKFILSMGKASDGFAGLVNPTGIAEKDGIIYVADAKLKGLYRFDSSGNYLGTLAEGQLDKPESLSFWKNGAELLIANTRNILSLNLATEKITELYRADNKTARFVSAVEDYNGNIAVSDFDNSVVLLLSEADFIPSGYNVTIENIRTEEFPKVKLFVRVQNYQGKPVTGLDKPNFVVSERIKTSTRADEAGHVIVKTAESINPVEELKLVGTDRDFSQFNINILAERSTNMEAYRNEARNALTDIYNSLNSLGKTNFTYTVLSKVPNIELVNNATLESLTKSLLTSSPFPVEQSRFDTSLRLAASPFFQSFTRNAVVYIGTGLVSASSFKDISLSELLALYKNNGVVFYAVLLPDEELLATDPTYTQSLEYLHFLADSTGGAVYNASRPNGLGVLAQSLYRQSFGIYELSYNSKSQASKDDYQSVAVESYLYRKSGRDEFGYFPPK